MVPRTRIERVTYPLGFYLSNQD